MSLFVAVMGGRGVPVACGLYACSPKGEGFVAEFTHFAIDGGRTG